MPRFAGTQSCWQQGAADAPHLPLRGTHDTDVCVVGAGIAGMTTAYLLAREGRTVIVLEPAAIVRHGGRVCPHHPVAEIGRRRNR